MLSGIIQGSVLGPTLLIAVINDFLNVITSSDMYLFAGDGETIGAASTANDRDAMQCYFQAVDDRSEQENMSLSIDKNVCLHYGYSNVNAIYVINDEPLKVMECCADLGILRSSDFRYKGHIDQICLKANELSGMVAKLFSAKNGAHCIIKLFTTYIRPLVE